MRYVVEGQLSDHYAERAILGGVVKYGFDGYIDVSDLVTTKSFTVEINKVIYAILDEIYRTDKDAIIDYPLVYSTAKHLGVDMMINKREQISYVRSIFDMPVERGTIRKLAAKVRKLEVARLLQEQIRLASKDLNGVTGEEPLSEILGMVEKPIFDFSSLLVDGNNSEPVKLGTNLTEYLDYIESNPVVNLGISSGYPIYDKAIGGGFRKGTVNVIGARPKCGKALCLNSLVYTTLGPKKMSQVQVGDILCHPDGGTTIVTGVFPQGKKTKCVVEFTDGDKVECCDEHLWEVYATYNPRKRMVKQTKELAANLIIKRQSRPNENEFRWAVKLTQPVPFESQKVPLDPYFVGLLLGDGSLRNTAVFHSSEESLHNEIYKLYPDAKIDYNNKKTGVISLRINSIQDQLRQIGIIDHNAHNKFIPEVYKYNSVEVRLSVLQGLLDTDGDCTKGRCRFASVSLQLMKDVKEIVCSLGGMCSISEQHGTYNGKPHLSYRAEIRLDNFVPFRLERKAKEFKKWVPKRKIESITYVGQEEMQCISVDAEDGLYLTDNFVVTHNTLIGDNIGLFVASKLNLPVLFLDTEMQLEDHYSRILANISSVTISDIETGQYAKYEDQRNRVREAAKTLSECPFHHISIAGKPFEETLTVMRRWLMKNVGYDENGNTKPCLIIFDYLKLMNADSLDTMQEYQVLGFIMTGLHNFAVQHKIPVLAFVQLNKDGINKESSDVVSQSDRIIWLCSNFTIFKRKSPEEIANDGDKNGNRKFVPILARHGGGLEDNDYISANLEGPFGRITEGKTRFEIGGKDLGGPPEKLDSDEEDDIPFN